MKTDHQRKRTALYFKDYFRNEAKKLGFEDPVKWNFTKFLIDENGKLITVIHNKTKPMSEEVLKYLN